jgi:hypothetical protein
MQDVLHSNGIINLLDWPAIYVYCLHLPPFSLGNEYRHVMYLGLASCYLNLLFCFFCTQVCVSLPFFFLACCLCVWERERERERERGNYMLLYILNWLWIKVLFLPNLTVVYFDRNVQQLLLSDKEQEEKTRKCEFIQGLLMSTVFDDDLWVKRVLHRRHGDVIVGLGSQRLR